MAVIITPQEALISTAREIVITDLAPGDVRLSATMEKPDGSYWASMALFEVGEDGVLDLSRQAPLSGDWACADPMATVWAMHQIRQPSDPARTNGVEALRVQISVRDAKNNLQIGSLTQHFLAEGVTHKTIDEPGLHGEIFYPAGEGPHPVVLGLNGSNGGMPQQRCALYAANGFIGVALAFFGAPGTPRYFGDTHLEYFEKALQWIRRELKPKDDFILVCGSSRGGELTLMLSSFFNEYVKAAVAFVPSAVVNGIQQAGEPGRSRDEPAWFWKGKALPNLWQGNPDADVSAYTTPEAPGLPIRQDKAFLQALTNKEFVEKASIPVEQIKGPVLLISGEDDGSWPSATFCRMVEERLHKHNHPWQVEHICNKRAGHPIGFPYIPTTGNASPHPVSGMIMSRGGTAEINNQASVHTWARVMEFMREAPALRDEGLKS